MHNTLQLQKVGWCVQNRLDFEEGEIESSSSSGSVFFCHGPKKNGKRVLMNIHGWKPIQSPFYAFLFLKSRPLSQLSGPHSAFAYWLNTFKRGRSMTNSAPALDKKTQSTCPEKLITGISATFLFMHIYWKRLLCQDISASFFACSWPSSFNCSIYP